MRFVVAAVLILATGCAKPTANAPAADAAPAADLASEVTAVGLAADATPQE